MSLSRPRVIELREYQPIKLPPDALPEELGELLWRDYARYVDVEFPSPKTNHQWRLTSRGWVGHLPLSPQLQLALLPKAPLANLFRMLEVAYRLDFERFDGLVDCETLTEFYQRLAHLLARLVLDRVRRGIFRAYLPRTEPLPYLRGRLDVANMLRSPVQLHYRCHYHEQTPDVTDNQILIWTLHTIARSGLCSERVLPAVRCAYHALQGRVALRRCSPPDCLNRLYHRLNDDYRPLHALCRFFLEHTGPAHAPGDRRMLPFLVDMARLYELFVAEWLGQYLPLNLRLIPQERVVLDQAGHLTLAIDLVLYEASSGSPYCVLDTKYKTPATPAHDDIFQVVAYAQAKGCCNAILLYPTPLPQPLEVRIGNICVKSLTFPLDGDWSNVAQTLIDALSPEHFG